VAEDAALLAFQGSPAEAQWLDDSATKELLDATATGNVPAAQAEDFIKRVLENLDHVASRLDDVGEEIAGRLVASHRRVREASGDLKRGLEVKVERPADILGVYVYLPGVN
jgi:hypothetical protein